MTLTVGSLFSGIGGLDLGLERAGMTVAWQAEVDPYCDRILHRHWPHVPNLGDVTTIEWENVPRVDLICGGYPCQPFSVAGRRRGADDPRHLWPHMLDAIRVLRPRWTLLENVPGHLALGFGRVLGDLAEIGFDAEWDCVPAAAVGAPHLRWRVFVVAYPNSVRRLGMVGRPSPEPRATNPHRTSVSLRRQPVSQSGTADVADATSAGRRRSFVTEPISGARPLRPKQAMFGGRGQPRRQPWWDVEPDVGRVAHGIPHRVDRLRALGNAVVPAVAEHIGRLIIEAAA